MIELIESPDLKILADEFYTFLDNNPPDNPLEEEIIITGNRVMEGWLEQSFLFNFKGRQRVWANRRMLQLNVFVNDCLGILKGIEPEKRQPHFHPFSMEAMRWRLYGILNTLSDSKEFNTVKDYCSGGTGIPDERRTFSMAGELARIFDSYQVYRPLMLKEWQEGGDENLSADLQWQKLIWQQLHEERSDSYLDQILEMEKEIPESSLKNHFPRISLFGISIMPPAYMQFLKALSDIIPVKMYIFNPSEEEWLDKVNNPPLLEGCKIESTEGSHTLLQGFGAGTKYFLEELHLRNEAEYKSSEKPENDSLLSLIKNDLSSGKNNAQKYALPGLDENNGKSLSIQICHSPLRELEVLHDNMLRWFAEDTSLQPRDIQVQVTDMKLYLPFIHAVFGSRERNAKKTIPYAAADRTITGNSSSAAAFLNILALADSRCKASEISQLLECDLLRQSFSIDTPAAETIFKWLKEAAVLWGIDKKHRRKILEADNWEADFGTWQRCIDRMLLGYALGRDNDKPVTAGVLGKVIAYDKIEGESALLLGKFSDFTETLFKTVKILETPRPLTEWSDVLSELIDNFFANNNDTYREIAELKKHVLDLKTFTEVTGLQDKVPCSIMASYLDSLLTEATGGDNLTANSVIFSALRPMSSTSRKYSCILGLNDGVFPRSDKEASFNLLKNDIRRCDRSLRREDRQAFLEAVFSADKTLYLSYVGRTEEGDEVMPPSTVLCELRDYISQRFNSLPTYTAHDNSELFAFETLHRLQPFHQSYFTEEENQLFSYSENNCAIAEKLTRKELSPEDCCFTFAPPEDLSEEDRTIDIAELARFFRDPASTYYQHSLQVRFEKPSEVVLPDSELSARDGLETFYANSCLVDSFINSVNAEETKLILHERGFLPYGDEGKKVFSNLHKNIQLILTKEIKEINDNTLGKLISENTELLRDSIKCGNFQISINQNICLLADGENLKSVSLRPSTIKNKDLLDSWLTQLFLSVINPGKTVGTLVCGLKSGKLEKKSLTAVDSEEAVEILTQYALLYFAGRTSILPFTPDASFRWQEAIMSDKDIDEAFISAQSAWQGSKFSSGEGKNLSFRQSFGSNGPMSDSMFAECAELIYSPLIENIVKSTRKTKTPAKAGKK
ncbi:MAG: exodeoxyribonuclease V subunit gamma [Planctomycetota bacterium]|jgi:exodeoxyribonuclease V gamma subunit